MTHDVKDLHAEEGKDEDEEEEEEEEGEDGGDGVGQGQHKVSEARPIPFWRTMIINAKLAKIFWKFRTFSQETIFMINMV